MRDTYTYAIVIAELLNFITLLPIYGKEIIVPWSNFQNGNFNGFIRFEVP